MRISGKYKAAVIAKILEMDPAAFDNYNPGFDREVVLQGYSLRLPKDKMELFSSQKAGNISGIYPGDARMKIQVSSVQKIKRNILKPFS